MSVGHDYAGPNAKFEGAIRHARYAQHRGHERVAAAAWAYGAASPVPSDIPLRYQTSDIEKLNIIHVAGTKGKGSTCAFIESFLGCHSERSGFPSKRGLYTSPHLIAPAERIRINMRPLRRDLFAKYFFEVFDGLSTHIDGAPPAGPRYLQLLFLLAIHTFIREKVDVAIIETHHGGEYDATNVIERPVVTAVTSLGMDHVSQLGPSLENIAWHKAGIFKPNAAAFSVPEEQEIAQVLQTRAKSKGADLTFVEPEPSLPQDIVKLEPAVQRLNCSLAMAVARSFIGKKDPVDQHLSPDDIRKGVHRFEWPARFQIVAEGQDTWYLDGAHNEMSVKLAAKWFMEFTTKQKRPRDRRVVIFGQFSEQRVPASVARSLVDSFQPEDVPVVIFTRYDPHQRLEAHPGEVPHSPALSPQDTPSLREFADIWLASHPKTQVLFAPDIFAALALAQKQASSDFGVHCLVTGSQHLAGGALFAMGRLA